MLPVEISLNGVTTRVELERKCIVSFSTFMIALKQVIVLPSEFMTDSFEYLDDEGDVVLVRSEDEFHTFVHSTLQGDDDQSMLTIRPVLRKKARDIAQLKLTLEDNGDADAADARVENDFVNSRSQRALPKSAAASDAVLNLKGVRSEDVRPLVLLGSGHTGSVFKALDVRNDRFVAVKSIALDLSPEVKEQILSEMNILYKCSSPFIIDFYGTCFTDNLISIYTEYMDGGSVDQAVRRLGRVEEPVLCAMAVAIVSGLVYLWEMKIMHRDVKPSNILINSNGDVKLCDFGVSVQLETSIAKSYVGTSVYMAPERLLGHDYTIHSDVWSLGLSLLEMVMGRFPYDDGTLGARSDPPALSAQEFTSDLCDFIGSCLRKDPHQRPTFNGLKSHSLITTNEPYNRAVIAKCVSQLLA